jgi:alkyl hydroperoxide reductase subunit D
MNIIGNPGVAKADFELWSLAVSAINGCSHCVAAHEKTLRDADLPRATVLEAIRLASIVSGVAQALQTADVLTTV